jgi:pantoate--beta-alanine ligase
MEIIRNIRKMFQVSKGLRCKGETVGFVPTMGALHQGHLSLIRKARKVNDIVVVSIFVNPLQFGPREDLKTYPRNLKRDALLCKKEGADVIFYPDKEELYPPDYKTYVIVQDLSGRLCGKSRPGHFKGVTTVVAKLFNIVNPDIAYFGQKDAQQAIIIKRMAEDLNMPTRIKVMPTVREVDGLALSSRNAYLNKEEKTDALVLPQSLDLAKYLIKSGIRDTDKIIRAISGFIGRKKTAKVDYVSIVDLNNLEPIKKINKKCLIALAVRIGKTRLIDNIIVKYANRNS